MRHANVETTAPVSQIGLGTWQFGSTEWGYGSDYDDREAAAIVRQALALGITLFDTAEVYGRGRSEEILGRALRDARADLDSIFLATKIFPVMAHRQKRTTHVPRRLMRGSREADHSRPADGHCTTREKARVSTSRGTDRPTHT